MIRRHRSGHTSTVARPVSIPPSIYIYAEMGTELTTGMNMEADVYPSRSRGISEFAAAKEWKPLYACLRFDCSKHFSAWRHFHNVCYENSVAADGISMKIDRMPCLPACGDQA